MTTRIETKEHSAMQFHAIWRSLRKELGIIIAILVMSAALAITNRQFISGGNVFNLFKRVSVVGLIALGQTHALISGAMDLSMGSIAGLSGMVSGHFLALGWSIPAAVIAGIVIGMLCGAFNGILIGPLRLHPFVVTLGTGTLFRGIIYFWTQGQPISDIPEPFYFLGQGKVAGLPFQFLILLFFIVIIHVLLSSSTLGRKIYAIGANETGGFFAGIDVAKTRFMIFLITGFFAAIAGIITCSELGTALPESGQAWLLPGFAAAIIGGVSLAGGEGKAIACLIGGFFMAIVSNAMVLLNFSLYWQQVGVGVFVIFAVLFDKFYRQIAK